MISLLILLPVLLLLLTALGIMIYKQFRKSIGYPWLWATGISIVTLAIILYMRWWLPVTLEVGQWQPFGAISSPPVFQLDYVSWPYALSLATLLLAVLFTDSARLQTTESGPLKWVASLVIAGFGLLSVMAGTPLTLILTWMAVDMFELGGVFSTQSGRGASQPMILTFSIRVGGTLLVMAALLLSNAWGINFTLNPIPARLGIFMILAVGLRLGVLPLNLPYRREVYPWRGLGNLLRMIGPASGLMVLGRMPAEAIPAGWQPVLLFFSALAAVYGSLSWLFSDSEQTGRSFWIISLSALAVGCVIRGNPQASTVWGPALVLVGSISFLYSAQNRRIYWIPLLSLLGLIGLPFTPAAMGLTGLMGPRFDIYSLLFLLSILFLCWGLIRRIYIPHEELYSMERWVHTVYPAGLLSLIIAQWLTAASNWRIAFITGPWLASGGIALVGVISIILYFRMRAVLTTETLRLRWVVVFGSRLGNVLGAVFRLNWLYQLLGWAYLAVQSFIQLLTALLEGDGGLLWAMVMLALLISLLTTGDLTGGLTKGLR